MTITVAASPAVERGSARRFAGTWALTRFALRRDRWLLPAWIVGLSAMAAFSAAATVDLYPTEASRVEAATTINATGAFVALYGQVYDPTSIGALSLIKMTAFGAALISLLFVFIVIRHTRTDEEAGRIELLSAGVVGRWAPLAAALITAMSASALLGAITAAGLIAVGLPTSGSLAFGAAWALSGIVFAAVAGVTAQIAQSHRAAIGLGAMAVALAYVLRAIGDLATGDAGWLSWLSPIGWSQQIRPFAGDRWWVGVIPIIATAVLIPVAFLLRSRRDLGSGMLPDRLGRAHGRLDTVEALAWRLQRGVLVSWVIGIAVIGVVLGSVTDSVTGFVTSEQMRQYVVMLGGEQALVEAFLAAELALVGVIVALYSVAAMNRLHAEEDAGHAELLLATPASRLRWALSHIVVALVGTAVLLVVMGVALGIGHGSVAGGMGVEVGRLTVAALAHAPAAWVMAGIVMVLFGWIPRAVPAAWGILVAFIVVGEFGELWKLPDWVTNLSPFAHSPLLPGGEVRATSLIGLVVVALILLVGGLVGWRRRDVRD